MALCAAVVTLPAAAHAEPPAWWSEGASLVAAQGGDCGGSGNCQAQVDHPQGLFRRGSRCRAQESSDYQNFACVFDIGDQSPPVARAPSGMAMNWWQCVRWEGTDRGDAPSENIQPGAWQDGVSEPDLRFASLDECLAPRFAIGYSGDPTLADVERRGVEIPVTCSHACDITLSITVESRPETQKAAVKRFARGTKKARANTTVQVRARPNAAGVKALVNAGRKPKVGVEISISASGYGASIDRQGSALSKFRPPATSGGGCRKGHKLVFIKPRSKPPVYYLPSELPASKRAKYKRTCVRSALALDPQHLDGRNSSPQVVAGVKG